MEKILKQYKTHKKLTVSFGIVILCCLIIGITGFITLWSVSESMQYFYDVPYQNEVAQLQIRHDTQSMMKNLLWACTTDDPSRSGELLAEVDKDIAKQQEEFALLKQNCHETELLAQLDKQMSAAAETRDTVIAYSKANNIDAALAEFNEVYSPRVNAVLETMTQLGERASDDAVANFADSKQQRIIAYCIIVIITVISLLLAVYLVRVVSRLIVKPIEQLESATVQFTKGDFNIQADYESQDELGSLANNFRHTATFLSRIIEDMNYLFQNLAKGNFNVRTTSESSYVGDFGPLLANLREMTLQISSAMRQISEASQQVSLGSVQMAQSAQDLAEGAADQAGSVEELQATISSVLSQTQRNTEQSRATADTAAGVKTEIVNSNREMAEMTAAMEKINETSAQINNIIGEIEDIASQTNLLSLNASIEAARAGEAGRGFAVVADQIGNLAEQSAQSAVNTRNLIENSINEVKEGSAISERTAASLSKVIESVEIITREALENSDASQQQEEAMQQIEQGIDQISAVVQNNSASAQETSATSEELAAQSENLKELVGRFELRH